MVNIESSDGMGCEALTEEVSLIKLKDCFTITGSRTVQCFRWRYTPVDEMLF